MEYDGSVSWPAGHSRGLLGSLARQTQQLDSTTHSVIVFTAGGSTLCTSPHLHTPHGQEH